MIKSIKLNIKEIDYYKFLKKVAKRSDCEKVAQINTSYYLGDKLIFSYIKLTNKSTILLKEVAEKIKLSKVERISTGLTTKGQDRTFGFRPKRNISVTGGTCTVTSLSRDFPKEAGILIGHAKLVNDVFKQHFPKIYEENKKETYKKIKSEWIIPETIYTSGIVNKNSRLPYHFDIGHVIGLYSCMITIKKGVDGGGLCLPEIDMYIPLEDSTLLIFEGQEFLHGVTNFIKKEKGAYRTTIVYYALEQMWKCLSSKDEIEKYRRVRNEREKVRFTKDLILNRGKYTIQGNLKKAKRKAI